MDENPISHPGVPEEVYHTLGKKTFWIFFANRIKAPMILLLVAIALATLQGEPFLKKTPLGDISSQVTLLAWVSAGVFALTFLTALLITLLIYRSYKFSLGDDALKIKRGVFNKEETAIPYRQIQNIDLERDFSFQMLGLSRIVILTAGEDEDKNDKDGSEGVLPALDKDLAEWLQAELLKRANVQKVVESPAQK